MPYRRRGNALAVATIEGTLGVELAADIVHLHLPARSVHITSRTVVSRRAGRCETFDHTGRVVVARGLPGDELAIWIEREHDGSRVMRRVFGVAPLHAPELTVVARTIRARLREQGDDVVRAIELGSRRDPHKLLLLERVDRHDIFMRPLFRTHAHPVLTRMRSVQSPVDIAASGMPWLSPEDRGELEAQLAAALRLV